MPLFDKKDKSRYATFTRRALGLGAGMTAVFGVLAGRLYQLQIRDGEEYKADAEDNRVSERLLAPPRGRILDRFGLELANNRRNYRVLLVAEQLLTVSNRLSTPLPDHHDHRRPEERILATIAGNKKFVPVPVAENLSWEEFSRVSEHLPYLPGVQADPDGQTRDYPFGNQMVHLLGYVGSVSPDDMAADDDPLLNVPGYRIGKRGIEKNLRNARRARPAGAVRDEVDARGRVIRELGRDKSTIGQDVWLTIDGELQKYATERMADQSGALIVTDVATGDVLALASTPGYDPNEFNVGITPDQWRALTENDHLPLLNKAMSGTYPPGSTFKPVVAAAAIDAGLATSDYRVTCNGRLTLGNHTFTVLVVDHPSPWPRFARRGRRASRTAVTYSSTRRTPAGYRQDPGNGAEAGPGCTHRHRNTGREIRLHSVHGLETQTLQDALATGRHGHAGIGQGYGYRNALAAGIGSHAHRFGPRRPVAPGASGGEPTAPYRAGAAAGDFRGGSGARARRHGPGHE